jgi:hypothetical protein
MLSHGSRLGASTGRLRVLDKWAVLIGGGENHRMGLYDMLMIKDNHVSARTDPDPKPAYKSLLIPIVNDRGT